MIFPARRIPAISFRFDHRCQPMYVPLWYWRRKAEDPEMRQRGNPDTHLYSPRHSCNEQTACHRFHKTPAQENKAPGSVTQIHADFLRMKSFELRKQEA